MQINSLTKKQTHTLLLLIFFLSGCAGLMYELVWIRVLSVIFGKTIGATTIVVSVYMAGLGLGSIYWGKRIDSIKNYIKIFSFIQFGIGLSCIMVLLLFLILPAFYRFIYNALHISQSFSLLLIFIISFFCMLVPTFLMGGTLPVISRWYIQHDEEIGKGIGILYTVNTLGAIIGAGLTGYILIGAFGLIQTQAAAIVMNVMLGAITYFMQTSSEKESSPLKSIPDTNYPNAMVTAALVIAGLSGFCGMAYEILATRVLGIFLVNSTYSFSSILICFLLGISIGSGIFTRYLSNRKQLIIILGILQIVIGVYLIVLTPFLNTVPTTLDPLRNNLLRLPLFKIILPGCILSFLLLLVPTVCMGMSFPIVCRVYSTHIKNIGNTIGTVYFINTIGSIVGPLIAGFMLIPFLGVSRGIISIACISFFTGSGVVFFSTVKKQRTMVMSTTIALLAVCIFAAYTGITRSRIHPPSLFRTQSRADAICYYKETSEGTVIVRENKTTGIRSLYVNNNEACGVLYDALYVVKMLGYLPFMVNPSLRDVCIIGFGAGITTAAIAQHTVASIDCIEICPGVKNAASYFSAYNNNIITNQKVRFIGGDGRSHLLLTKKYYDCISCDPIHPTLGCGNLYTKEYFELCRNRLNDKGVVSQYLPLHRLSLYEFKSLIKTFSSVFPHTTVWLAHSHCVLLGSLQKIAIDFNYMRAFLWNVNDQIVNDPYLVAAALFLDDKAIRTFTRDARIHSDNRPFLEFFTPESQLKQNWHINCEDLLQYRIDPTQYIYNVKDLEKLGRYLLGQDFFLAGLIAKNKGNRNEVLHFYKKAAEINPENNEIRFFLEDEARRIQAFQQKK